MERIKLNKVNLPSPKSEAGYQQDTKGTPSSQQEYSSPFILKYASSIIQVVSQDRLESSTFRPNYEGKNQVALEQTLINELRDKPATSASIYQEQNNYYNAAKMKRKAGNRKLLAYNFSNLTLLTHKINAILKKRVKNSLDLVRSSSIKLPDSFNNKNKRENKRGSDCSGYTASTSNDQKPSKRESKKLTDEKRREMRSESANQIRGCLSFKLLIFLSHAFKCIRTFNTHLPFQVSQVSTIKGSHQENNCQADYSITIARQIPQSLSSSSAYDTEQNFQFTQKDVTLATPQKFSFDEKVHQMPKKRISYQQSFVESYKPKEFHIFSPKRLPLSRNIISPRPSKPIKVNILEHNNSEILTNLYELPLLNQKELRCEQKKMKDLSILEEHFVRNQPQICLSVDGLLKDLEQVSSLFKPKPSKSIKNIEPPREKEGHTKVIYSSFGQEQKKQPKLERNEPLSHQNQKSLNINGLPLGNQREKTAKQSQKTVIQHTKTQKKPQKQLPQRYQNHNERLRSPTILNKEPINAKIVMTSQQDFNPNNIYQLNYNQPKRVSNLVKPSEKIVQQPQIRIQNTVNSPAKIMTPVFRTNAAETRQNIMISQPNRNDSNSKKNFYSPQVSKEYLGNNLQMPVRMNQPLPMMHQPVQNLRVLPQASEISTSQAEVRAVNLNNNYYFTGSQAVRPLSRVNEPMNNVFQDQVQKTVNVQGMSMRQSNDRMNIFNNCSPLNSQLEERSRSRNRSELSRPKSMNEKIFITLRKQK